ncbi:MAG: RNA polymerase subunit sigma-24, partial [Planctomycetes bacterium]|nr:RNA polymerase subunit sigma-24 [Planctomycetota bacterium]
QIADILELATGTVKSRLSRARRAIREELLMKQQQ